MNRLLLYLEAYRGAGILYSDSIELHDLTDHRAFRRKLKTFLFERAFSLLYSDSLAASQLGVSDGQSESESESERVNLRDYHASNP